MADSKVTDFAAATTVNAADVLYLIQSSTDKKISISTLLANLPNSLTKFSGLIALGFNNAQTLVGSGIIQTSQTLTLLSNTGTTSVVTINDGAYDGQLKVLLCTGASANISITNNIKATSLTFSKAGDTSVLVWFNNDWWILGGTAVVV